MRGCAAPGSNQIGVSFCMIVRDGAATLADCLSSVASIADEFIVIDTGSRDDTVNIARRFGARVITAPWTDDFAAARNRYLDAARGPWILSLDADERLPNPDPDAIRAIIGANPRTAFGVTIRNFFHHDLEWPRFLAPSEFGGRASDELSWHVSRTIRLFPRVPGLTYRYPVHESLIPAARELGLRLRLSDVVIHHRDRSPMGGGRARQPERPDIERSVRTRWIATRATSWAISKWPEFIWARKIGHQPRCTCVAACS